MKGCRVFFACGRTGDSMDRRCAWPLWSVRRWFVHDSATQVLLVYDKKGFHPDLGNRVNALYANTQVEEETGLSASLATP